MWLFSIQKEFDLNGTSSLTSHHEHIHFVEELVAISTVLLLFLIALVAFACSLHQTQATDGCRQSARSCCCCCCCCCCREKDSQEPQIYDSLQELLIEAERGEVARLRSDENERQISVETFFIDLLHQDEKTIGKQIKKKDARYRREPGDGRLEETLL